MFNDEFKILKSTNNLSKFLPKYFNQNPYFTENCNFDDELTSLSHKQVVSERTWPQIDKVNAWMVSAETAPYMKIGGLGMVAKDFPESFNQTFNKNEEYVTVITPLYLGKTPKKHAHKKGTTYTGAEGNSIKIKKLKTIKVPFLSYSENELIEYPLDIFIGKLENTDYIFLSNETYFSINPHIYNNSAQDGCYVFNEHGIKETERFAFFSKAVYEFIKDTVKSKSPVVAKPNIIIANDWHAGSLSGLCKCLTHCKAKNGDMSQTLANKLQELPVIHIAHHFGYQGWEFEKTPKILNSLYEDCARDVYKNSFTTHNENSRMKKAIMIGNSFNQACCNVNLADKIVTVSRNYRDEVTKEVEPFGYDFKDILNIRKDNNTFYGIVNGYEKTLIVPSKDKIEDLNKFFSTKRKFSYYDENSISEKFENKKTFIKLLSKLTTDKTYREKVLPKIEMYEFEDIIDDLAEIDNIPILCATSRLVEQKGYDILADAIYDFIAHGEYKTPPIFILGGAGSIELFDMLMKLKNRIASINPVAARRLFVFRGFNDFFAYAIQLASDFYLMPSKFEPCGLTQMEAMAKGSVPVATSTGGLVDTILPGIDGFRTEVFYSATRQIYGDPALCSEQYNNTKAFTKAMADAINTFYEDKPKFDEMVKNAMEKDFSWNCKDNGAVFSYYKLFKTGKID